MILVRSMVFNIFFYLMTFCLTWPGIVIAMVVPRRLMGIVRLWAHLAVGGARVICGIHLRVTGLEKLPPGAALIASAHQSAFDTFVWFTLVPRCRYVLKRELTRIPVFGSLITVSGQIPLDRHAGASAMRALLRTGGDALRSGGQVLIFPEGTRSEPGTVGPLHPGVAALAARANVPVIPVATDSGLCWSRKAFVKRPGTITIVVGDPIPASLPREALMARLHAQFAVLHRREEDVERCVDKSVQETGADQPVILDN
jgi:1-acyl-sn-glycerol-3-phosphate acyltransferase